MFCFFPTLYCHRDETETVFQRFNLNTKPDVGSTLKHHVMSWKPLFIYFWFAFAQINSEHLSPLVLCLKKSAEEFLCRETLIFKFIFKPESSQNTAVCTRIQPMVEKGSAL